MRISARTTPKVRRHRLGRWQEQKDPDPLALEATVPLEKMKTAGQELLVRLLNFPIISEVRDLVNIRGPLFHPLARDLSFSL